MIRQAINNDYNDLSMFYREFDENGVDLFEQNPFTKVFVYEEGKEIVGFISYNIAYDRAEINYIYVSDKKRKSGIASKLMEFCVDEAVKNGCVNITLEVSKENKAGISLYEKFGFKEAAIRPRYYHGVDGILMIRELIK